MNLTKLKPIPTKEETAALEALQSEWQKWSEHRDRYHVDRIGHDMEQARRQFIADPTEANEAELLRCADSALLAKQYRAVREACDKALHSLAYRLRDIVRPMLERAIARLQEDLAKAEAVEAKERQRIEEKGGYFCRAPKSDCSALELRISRLRDDIRELEQLTTRREPVSWLRQMAKI